MFHSSPCVAGVSVAPSFPAMVRGGPAREPTEDCEAANLIDLKAKASVDDMSRCTLTSWSGGDVHRKQDRSTRLSSGLRRCKDR